MINETAKRTDITNGIPKTNAVCILYPVIIAASHKRKTQPKSGSILIAYGGDNRTRTCDLLYVNVRKSLKNPTKQ